MVTAMAETEKLRAAGDAYKRELLAARLAERDGELSAARDRLHLTRREAASLPRLYRATLLWNVFMG